MTSKRAKKEEMAPEPEEEKSPHRLYTFRSDSGDTEVRIEGDVSTGAATVTYDRAGHRVDMMLVPEEPV